MAFLSGNITGMDPGMDSVRRIQTGDHDLDVTAVLILGIAGQSSSRDEDLGAARQDGHAVLPTLPDPGVRIPGLAQGGFGKVCLIGFEFLQTYDVRLRRFQPSEQLGRRLLTLLMLNVATFMRDVSGLV